MAKRRKADTHELLSTYISEEMSQAEGGPHSDGSIESFREEALAYYKGDARGDEIVGRSQIVSMDLAAAVNANEALMRSMLVDEAVIRIEAEGPEDESQAQAETDITRDIIYKYNEGSRIVMASVKDSLLSRIACIALDADKDEETEQITFNLRSVPSENICFQAGYEGKLQDIRFFAERVQLTRSDLVEMGIDRKVAMNAGTSAVIDNAAQVKRNADRSSWPGEASTEEMEIVDSWYVYLRADLDNDGIAERYRCLYIDDECIDYIEHDLLPYALGNPFILPHRLSGESLHDRLRHVQDIGTALDRQLIDNVNLLLNGRYVYNPAQVNEQDVMEPVAGGGIRASNPDAIQQLAVLDVTPGIMAAKEQNRRRRSEIAGAALDMASAEAQIANKTATQVSIEKSNSELVSVLMASNLAEGLLRGLHMLVHEYLRRYATRPYIARVNGQAVPVNPLEFRPERHWTATPGKSPQEKGQEAMALQQHIQLLATAMQSGMDGVLADANTLYRSQMRYLRLNGVADPEAYAIDPASPQAQQAQQAAAEQAQQIQQMQAQMAQMQIQLEQAKIAEDGRQADQELQWKYYDTQLDAEVKASTEATRGAIELEKTERTNQAGIDSAQQGAASNGQAN